MTHPTECLPSASAMRSLNGSFASPAFTTGPMKTNMYLASFPLVAVLGRSRDYYEPRLTPNIRFLDSERWQRKRKTDDRDVEEAALLIALAQKHAEVLKVSRLAGDDVASRSNERLHVFHVSRATYRATLTLRELILHSLSKSHPS